MTTLPAADSIESLLGESLEAVHSREKTSLEALVHARNARHNRAVPAGSGYLRLSRAGASMTLTMLIHDMLHEHNMYSRTYQGDGWQSVAYAVPKQRVLA